MIARSRIGLLGGSFNPAHDGHYEISMAALKTLNLETVWWLVSPGNPLKNPSIYKPYTDRITQARKIADDARIVVSNFEQRRKLQYTIDTLTILIDEHPAVDFVWLMGSDSLQTFHKWKRWRDIFTTMPIAVFNRPGAENAADTTLAAQDFASFRLPENAAHQLPGKEAPAWVFVSSTANPQSSTELRNNIS